MPRLDRMLARAMAIGNARARSLCEDGLVINAQGTPLSWRTELTDAELPMSLRVGDAPLQLFSEVHILQNKPAGCVTALRDPQHPVAYDLLHEAPMFSELRAVGRLDRDTTGLLLWTTDGQWVQRLCHPKRRVPRTYQAALTNKPAPMPKTFALEDGHKPDIVSLRALERDQLHPSLLLAAEATAFAEVTIIGGAYHEVRRIFAALGSHVVSLCRTSYGPVILPPDMKPGTFQLIDLPALVAG